jgi:hypothetical protein
MKTRQNHRNCRWWVLLGVLVLAMGLLPNQAQADWKEWVGGTGSWDIGTNWDPVGQPIDGDWAFIRNDGPDAINVYYRNTLYPEAELAALSIGGTSTHSGTTHFHMFLDHSLITRMTEVGVIGDVIFRQSAGSHVVHGRLSLGYAAGTGTYELRGGTLEAEHEELGYLYNLDIGNFIQTGGTNTTGSLFVGYNGIGTYELHGGELVAGGIILGENDYSEGTFIQTGGTNRVTSRLTIGQCGECTGTYELHGGDLEAGEMYVGYTGTGTFTQTGGGNRVFGDLKVGAIIGTGTYNLSGGAMLAENEYVGEHRAGTFNQTGGVNQILHTLYLGEETGCSGTYELGGGILAPSSIHVGNEGSGVFRQTAGTIFCDHELYVGLGEGGGSFDLQGGNLWTLNTIIGDHGTGDFSQSGGRHSIAGFLEMGNAAPGSYTLSGDGSLEADREKIGVADTGTFTQSGGSHQVSNYLNLGYYDIGEGTYSLSGGILSASVAYVGGEGTGTFSQDGGTFTLSGDLSLGHGRLPDMLPDTTVGPRVGTYTLSEGHLEATNEYVGYAGTGTFTQTGGFNKVGNTLALAVNPGSSGQYHLEDGYLETGSLDVGQGGTFHQESGTLNCGDLSNRNTVNLNGGVATVTGNVTNEASAQLNIANDATFSGTTNNYGTVKVTDTTVTWGTYVEHGTYISDPATQIFNNLTVYPDGFIVAGEGDYFLIKGDFINMSEANQAWNTQAACLKFIKGESILHVLGIPGLDLGGVSDGYLNNFAWGCLDLGGKETDPPLELMLMDTDNNPGGALYVGEILGLQLRDGLVTNIIGNGLNLYYDPSLLGNKDLQGMTFNLIGGGCLKPTPLPPSAWLFLSGLAGLGLLRKGRKLWKG